MKKIIVPLFLIAVAGTAFYFSRPSVPEAKIPQSATAPLEELSVSAGALVTSPLVVTGKAPGPWFFEAFFPVSILDAAGNEIARMPAQAQEEWMTEKMVRFSAELSFATTESDTGSMVLEKDNPSGLPENAQQIVIPVRFK